MPIRYSDTKPAAGDSDNTLLAKIAQSLGVAADEGSTPNEILHNIAAAASSGSGGGGGFVSKTGDTMSGALIVNANITSSGTVTGSTVSSTGPVSADSASITNGISGGSVTSTGALTVGSTVKFSSAADGVLKLTNSAGNSFSYIQFGGTNLGFPALKRSSATLQARLADDSDYANFSAKNLVASGTVTGSNLSGTNTGDQTITLTGDVTGSGTGSFAASISENSVTFLKMQAISTGTILGRSTAGSGNVEAISVGSGLTLSGGSLTATGSGGTVTTVSVTTANGVSGTVANAGSTPAITLTLGAITPSSITLGTTVKASASADGVLKLTDSAGTAFGYIQLGGTTTSYPALKRSSAIVQARLADDSAFTKIEALNFLVTPTATTYGSTTNLDFDGTGIQTIALTGNITFTTSNKASGKSLTIKILADSSIRTFTFPAWIFVGAAAPASIAANKTAILTITCFDTTDANIVAAYSVQP